MESLLRDLSRPVTREQAARLACLEQAYFSKLFHTSTGLCFAAWRRMTRIAEARRLLLETNLQITVVGETVGFAQLRTFERSFQREVGIGPREYRKVMRKQDTKCPILDTNGRDSAEG